ncbi:MAG: ATP-binding cassette domain-containing protein [Rikenellaceae bacterium]
MVDEVLAFKDVTICFDESVVVEKFNCSVRLGERVAIMGSSGCGKSSLLAAAVGLTPLCGGGVEVCGVEVKGGGVERVRRQVAWLPQLLELPYESVQELFSSHFNLKVNTHLRFDIDKCGSLLERVGMDVSYLQRSWSTLSGGERQRLMVVCAVMLERKVLLLDEPTSALDALSRGMVAELLSSLDGVTILAVTHDEEFAQSFDRVIRLWGR